MTNVPWPEDLLQRCVALWREGRDATIIGAELGKSKNAIIGRMRRMRVDSGDQTLLRKLPPDRTKPKVPKVKRVPKVRPIIEEPTHIRGKLWVPPYPIEETACHLWRLTLKKCRWPVGEVTGEFQLFCGLPADLEEKRPYCEGHSQIAYRVRGRNGEEEGEWKPEVGKGWGWTGGTK